MSEFVRKFYNQNSFEVISYAGAENFAGGMTLQLEKLEKEMPQTYENIITAATENCESKQFRNSTDHLQIVVRKI